MSRLSLPALITFGFIGSFCAHAEGLKVSCTGDASASLFSTTDAQIIDGPFCVELSPGQSLYVGSQSSCGKYYCPDSFKSYYRLFVDEEQKIYQESFGDTVEVSEVGLGVARFAVPFNGGLWQNLECSLEY